jgi:hypothetical protein
MCCETRECMSNKHERRHYFAELEARHEKPSLAARARTAIPLRSVRDQALRKSLSSRQSPAGSRGTAILVGSYLGIQLP